MSEQIYEAQNEVPEIMYYAGESFFSSLYINTAYANGYTDADLTEISREDYDAWFNPPEGKYGAWVDGKPVLLDVPAPDYVGLANQQRDALITEANAATYTLSLKMQMNRKLTDAETAKVNAWLDYIDALNELDLSKAPEISWPEKPIL